MAEFKLVLNNPKTGKSHQIEVKDDVAKHFLGQKIGNTLKGELIDLTGYEFQITGGSDKCGFPMRADITGNARKKIFSAPGVGISNKKHRPNPKKKGWRKMTGMRRKKTVAGNTIHELTAQVNLKITKHGRGSLPGEEATETKTEEPKTENKKEEVKTEDRKVETPKEEPKKEEKPKEKKVEEKPEIKEEPTPEDKKVEEKLEEIKKEEEEIKKEEEEIKKEDIKEKEIEEELKKVDKELEENKKE